MTKGISRTDDVFLYIKDYYLKNRIMPSKKQIEYDLKIGNGSLNRILDRLVKTKLLKKMHYSFPINYRLGDD